MRKPRNCSGLVLAAVRLELCLRLLLGLGLELPPEAGEAEAGRRGLRRTSDLVRLLEHGLTESLLIKM